MLSLSWVGMAFIVVGALLIMVRMAAARKLTELYRKWGVEVPEDRYARQFVFIGVVLVVIGLLVTAGLIEKL